MLKFTYSGTPKPQSRVRFANGRAYEKSDIKEYKWQIAHAAKLAMNGESSWQTAVSVDIDIRRKFPTCSRRFGDIDNHIKAILDALNGVVWLDDSLITSVTARKVQSADEGITVEVF